MSQRQHLQCVTLDKTPQFGARTKGDCQFHCKLEDSEEGSTMLTVKITNKTTASFWIYVTPRASKQTIVQPSERGCRKVDGRDSLELEFALWHDGNSGTVDVIEIDIEYSRFRRHCENSSRTTMQVSLLPEFEYA